MDTTHDKGIYLFEKRTEKKVFLWWKHLSVHHPTPTDNIPSRDSVIDIKNEEKEKNSNMKKYV